MAESLGSPSQACASCFTLTHVHVCVHRAGTEPSFQHPCAGPCLSERCYCSSFQKLRTGQVCMVFFTFLLLDGDCHLPRKLSTLVDTGTVDTSYLYFPNHRRNQYCLLRLHNRACFVFLGLLFPKGNEASAQFGCWFFHFHAGRFISLTSLARLRFLWLKSGRRHAGGNVSSCDIIREV